MKFLVVNKNTILVIKVFENNSRFFFFTMDAHFHKTSKPSFGGKKIKST